MDDRRYNVSLGPKLDRDLERIADELEITKAEALRRALTLFTHAVDADAVKLVTKDGDQIVIVK